MVPARLDARRAAGRAATPALLAALLLLAAGAAPRAARAQLLLSRPEADCLAPAVTTLSAYNFFPSAYQLQPLQATSAGSSSGLSTTVEFAADFSVTYHGTYKVVTNKRVNETYLLYQCGTPNPAAAGDTEAAALPAGAKVFEVPLHSVAVTDSNAAGFLAELGLLDRVAFASRYSINACLQAILNCSGEAVGTSAPFGSPASEWETLSAAQQGRVDAVLTGEASSNPKSIAITSFADPGALNRAEWVKFVAVFFNKEVEANKLFANISSAYEALNASARAAAAAAPAPRRVAWVSAFGDALSVSLAQYKVQLMTDAGGVLPAPASIAAAGGERKVGAYGNVGYTFNASLPASRAGFFGLLQDVDVLFDESYTPASSNLLDVPAFVATYGPEAAALPAVANGSVYAFNARLASGPDGAVGSDWFEGSVARPDLVLRDFVAVITPAAAPNTQLTWLRRLAAAPSVAASNGPAFTTAAGCTTINSAAGAAGRCARPEPARICPNAFRDCTTGELKTVTDPTQRCAAQTVCPDATPVANATKKNAAQGLAPAGLARALTLVLAAAAALALC